MGIKIAYQLECENCGHTITRTFENLNTTPIMAMFIFRNKDGWRQEFYRTYCPRCTKGAEL